MMESDFPKDYLNLPKLVNLDELNSIKELP
jgi:hypothetical protein